VPPAAKLDAPTLADAPAVPPTAPSTLAPSAYDTDETTESAPEDEDLLDGPVAGARPGLFSKIGARAAMGGVVLLLGLWLVVRGRHGAQPADAQNAESGAQAQAATAAAAVVPDLPDIPDEPPTAQTAPVDDATALELQRKARELLTSGQIVEGVAYARRAIAARPLDGDNYILLAAGLQDLGQWQQARNIFSQCVKRSGGPTTVECQYFATQGN
jgi:tetratricopeptide (TPR) repeat protein